jgi:hypothetical protein
MKSDDKRKNNIQKCGYVVDGEACMKFVHWTPGNSESFCQKHFRLWQWQINTRHPGYDRTAAHNDGIIIDASTSVLQEEMNWDQPSTQPRSANPVDTTRHNNGMTVNESIRAAHTNGIIVSSSTSIRQEEMNGDQPSMQTHSANPVDTRRNNNGMTINELISIQQEESIVIHATVQPLSAIQHCWNEPPNIDSARVKRAADNDDIHANASSGIQQEERVIAASTKKQLCPDDDMSHHDTLTIIPHYCLAQNRNDQQYCTRYRWEY